MFGPPPETTERSRCQNIACAQSSKLLKIVGLGDAIYVLASARNREESRFPEYVLSMLSHMGQVALEKQHISVQILNDAGFDENLF